MQLKPSEYICKKCNGSGLFNAYKPKEPLLPVFIVYDCIWCDGTGKVDWIANILGKRGPFKLSSRRITRNKYNAIKTR